MTLEEAKKILNEEGFGLEGPGRKSCAVSEAFMEYESPEVCEAMQVVCSAGYMIKMFESSFNARKERLKKEYGKNHIKCGDPIFGSPLSAVEGMKLQWKDNKNTDKNPALAEAASQFNDALLDEQAKKIAELTKENEDWKSWSELQNRGIAISNIAFRDEKHRLGKEIARLNGIIHDKNEELKRKTKGCCELVAENVDLKEVLRKTESLLHDTREANSKNLDSCFKNEDIIDDLKKKLAEKTRLAKKYGKELEDSSLGLCKLEKKLADKDAVLSDVAEELRLAKIREKNLTELCQKYIKANEELKKELADRVVDKINANALKSAESALAWKEKVIAKKDMELAYYEKKIAEKDEALDEANKHQQQAYRSCADKNKEIKALKLQISAWEKRGNGIDWKRNADAIKLYVNHASRERLWNPISQDICNEKELSFIINHGGKRVKYALRFDGTDIVYECSDPDKKPSLFRDDSVGAVTNLKDCSLAKDTVDIAEEGGDNSGVIVLCGKDFIDAIKKMK